MYQASIGLLTEQTDKNGFVIAGTFQDHGEVQLIEAPTLQELFQKLDRQYVLKEFENFENERLEATSISIEDKNILETTVIYILNVTYEQVSIDDLINSKSVSHE